MIDKQPLFYIHLNTLKHFSKKLSRPLISAFKALKSSSLLVSIDCFNSSYSYITLILHITFSFFYTEYLIETLGGNGKEFTKLYGVGILFIPYLMKV